MRIVMITENDPAGMGIAFTNALNRYTGSSCRLITLELRYNFLFEKDLHLPDLNEDGFDEIRDALCHADIIHFHMLADEQMQLGPLKVKDFIKGKTICHHHHGHPVFRGNPDVFQRKYRDLKRTALLVSTPDLLHLLPGAVWMPNIVPVYDSLYLPQPEKNTDLFYIAHSPTRKELKNTADLVPAIKELEEAGVPVELALIENTLHRECLRRKKHCHFLFDHMQGYFGVSSLEGLSQGLCVLAGLDEWNRRHIVEFTGKSKLPWVLVRKENLKDVIVQMILESGWQEAGNDSRYFMEHFWSEQIVVDRLIRFYETI